MNIVNFHEFDFNSIFLLRNVQKFYKLLEQGPHHFERGIILEIYVQTTRVR